MSPKQLESYRDQSRSYERFPPNGRLHIACPQCRALVLLFEDLDTDLKTEIAALKGKRTIEAIKLPKLRSGVGLAHAKAAVFHVCKNSTCCHCSAPIPEGALLCSQCLSVNLHW
jgi:hypothetical protein